MLYCPKCSVELEYDPEFFKAKCPTCGKVYALGEFGETITMLIDFSYRVKKAKALAKEAALNYDVENAPMCPYSTDDPLYKIWTTSFSEEVRENEETAISFAAKKAKDELLKAIEENLNEQIKILKSKSDSACKFLELYIEKISIYSTFLTKIIDFSDKISRSKYFFGRFLRKDLSSFLVQFNKSFLKNIEAQNKKIDEAYKEIEEEVQKWNM